MKIVAILMLSLLFLASCDHRDPNPEQSDVVYRDLVRELEIANKSLEAARIELATREEEYRKVVPQTGQIKSYEQKYFQAINEVEKLGQQKQFFEISIEQRKNHVRARYHESFSKGGKPWPDKEEVETFERAQKLRREKLTHERNKGIVKDVPRGTNEH